MSTKPSKGVNFNEEYKFGEDSGGEVFVRTKSIGDFLSGYVFDCVVASYPDSVTEVYTYKTGGVGGDTVVTVTVTYTDSSKNTFSSVVRT